jgi:hypothetical protein
MFSQIYKNRQINIYAKKTAEVDSEIWTALQNPEPEMYGQYCRIDSEIWTTLQKKTHKYGQHYRIGLRNMDNTAESDAEMWAILENWTQKYGQNCKIRLIKHGQHCRI